MKDQIEKFVAHKKLALVGASSRRAAFGNYAAKELRARGYEVRLVHPSAERIDDVPCARSLGDVAGEVEGVVVCVPPERGAELLRESARLGLQEIWIQQGAESAEVLRAAEELGLTPIWGRCILMHAPPVKGFHGFHRWLAKLFGRLYAAPRRPRPALPAPRSPEPS